MAVRRSGGQAVEVAPAAPHLQIEDSRPREPSSRGGHMWATGPVRFVGCAAMFVLAAPCAAQVSVDVMPLAGLYAAQSQLFYRVDYTCDRDFEGACGDGPVRQRTTPLIGARVRTWVGSRLAADFSPRWAGSNVHYAPNSMTGIRPRWWPYCRASQDKDREPGGASQPTRREPRALPRPWWGACRSSAVAVAHMTPRASSGST